MSHKDPTLCLERPVRVRGKPTGAVAPPGYEYCWECGYVAPLEVFLESDKCPNSKCPNPTNWDE